MPAITSELEIPSLDTLGSEPSEIFLLGRLKVRERQRGPGSGAGWSFELSQVLIAFQL